MLRLEKMQKDEKSSDAITTTDTLLNDFESNYTYCSIEFVLIVLIKFEFCIIECNAFFLIQKQASGKALCNKRPLSSFFNLTEPFNA